MDNKNILRLNFTHSTTEIELIDTPITHKWITVFSQYRNLLKNSDKYSGYTVSTMELFPHLSTGVDRNFEGELINQEGLTEQQIVDKINKYIEDANLSIKGAVFPYEAYVDMPWEQTNLLHRCFTTGIASKKVWKHNFSYKELIESKKLTYEFGTGVFNKLPKEGRFVILDHEKFSTAVHGINHFVHSYETLFLSSRLTNKGFCPDKNRILFFEWDTYTDDFRHSIKLGEQATYNSVAESIPENTFDYDVFVGKSILGKSYEFAYSEFDDLLEWDITNLNQIKGTIQIISNKDYFKWIYESSPFALACQEVGLPKELYYPIPIGKIIKNPLHHKMIKPDRTKERWSSGSYRTQPPYDSCIPSLEIR